MNCFIKTAKGRDTLKVFMTVLSIIIVLVIAYFTLLFANRGEDASLNPSGGPSATTSANTTPYNGPVNPLTGLPADESIVHNRPYAVMIDNISTAQPQIGISKADIIYEILAEGGITRMMAIYQDVSAVGKIGSVRSARPYFVDIASGYDAIYIHAGGSNDAYSEIEATGIIHFDGVNGKKQDIFYRDPDRLKVLGYVHSLVTTGELILKYLPTYGISLVHKDGFKSNMTFSDSAAPSGGLIAQNITVDFSPSKKTAFAYSAEDGLYRISQYGKDYIDGNDGTEVGVANLLVLKTTVADISGDTAGRIDIATTGSGTGYYFCGGKYTAIKWTRAKPSDQFAFTLPDGTSLVLEKGKSYICVISASNHVDIT